MAFSGDKQASAAGSALRRMWKYKGVISAESSIRAWLWHGREGECEMWPRATSHHSMDFLLCDTLQSAQVKGSGLSKAEDAVIKFKKGEKESNNHPAGLTQTMRKI